MVWIGALLLSVLPLDVGSQKQLFLDRRFIAESDRIELRSNPPQKIARLLDQDGQPIQGHIARVVDEGDTARLYLGADSVEILESKDGLTFRRTGTRIGSGGFSTIFHDAHDPNPARRYKLFHLEFSPPFDPERHGVFASYSADGINFTKVGRVLPFFTDNPTIANWDPKLGKYVIYTRAFDYNSQNQRRIGRIETDDVLQPWPYKKTDHDKMFLGLDNVDVVLSADAEDDSPSDIYYNAATLYPWAADTYLMFTSQFRHFYPQRQPFVRPSTPGQWEDFGMLEVQLAVSRDGVHWDRPDREPYVRPGLPDEWDRWYAVMAPGMVRRGNYLYQYYYSSGRLHDGALLREEYRDVAPQLGGAGVVRQRLDGFVSADADFRGGSLRTPPITFRGKSLRLNVDTGSMGTAHVEIQNEQGEPLPGFSLADCEEIGGNFIDQRVSWRGSADVSGLADRPIRLRIVLKRAKLYAFQFTAD